MTRVIFSWVLKCSAVLFLASCGGDATAPPPNKPPPSPCAAVPVDRFKELVIVEPSVVNDARTSNEANGPWSFRHLVESMVPPGASTSDFLLRWLNSFEQEVTFNRFLVPRRAKANEVLLCPWLRQTPENGCDNTCTTCAARTLDLAKAPFRLLAFTNRVDLRETEDLGGAGESRMIFAATEGPGDDPASPPLRMTVAFEYKNPLSEGRTSRYWAEKWHALGTHQDYGDAFMTDLASLYAQIVERPTTGEASWLNQLRTNEVDLDWQWDLREFKLNNGNLQLAATARTPDKSLNGTKELADFVLSNREAILAAQHSLPQGFEGGFAQTFSPWFISGVDEVLRKAFASETCDGCHQGERVPRDQNFHISPLRSGLDALSPFLHNPADTSTDDLARRTVALRNALCDE